MSLKLLWLRAKMAIVNLNPLQLVAVAFIGFVAVSIGLTIFIAARHWILSRRHRAAGVDRESPGCVKCLYPIRGNMTSTCTECGCDLAETGVRVGVSLHLAVALYVAVFWLLALSSAAAIPSSMWLLEQGTAMAGVSDASSITPADEPQFLVSFQRVKWMHLPLPDSRRLRVTVVGRGFRYLRYRDADDISIAELVESVQAVNPQMSGAMAQHKAEVLAAQIAAWESGLMPLMKCLPEFGRPEFAKRAGLTHSLPKLNPRAPAGGLRYGVTVPQWLSGGPYQTNSHLWVWLGIPEIVVVTGLGAWWVIRRHKPGIRPLADFVGSRETVARDAA